MLETIFALCVLALFATPPLVLLYAVKDAGEDAIRDYAEQLRKGEIKP